MIKEDLDYDIKKIATPIVEREPMTDIREYREKFHVQTVAPPVGERDSKSLRRMLKR
jgi:hypothetical protein